MVVLQHQHLPLVMFNAQLQGLHCSRQPLSSKLSVCHFCCMMTDPGSAYVITESITLKSHPPFPSVLLNFALRLRAINEICVHYYTQCSLSLLLCTHLSLNSFIHTMQIILHAYFVSAQVIIKPKRCKLIYSSHFNLQFFHCSLVSCYPLCVHSSSCTSLISLCHVVCLHVVIFHNSQCKIVCH